MTTLFLCFLQRRRRELIVGRDVGAIATLSQKHAGADQRRQLVALGGGIRGRFGGVLAAGEQQGGQDRCGDIFQCHVILSVE